MHQGDGRVASMPPVVCNTRPPERDRVLVTVGVVGAQSQGHLVRLASQEEVACQ